jgi:hypothetical protein
MAQVHCNAYLAEDAPARWWRKIELVYRERTLALVYDAEPPPGELAGLMFHLQTAAARVALPSRSMTQTAGSPRRRR